MTVEESEFSAALRFDIAAAMIAAIKRPLKPCGICVEMNVGKIASDRANAERRRKFGIKHEQHRANQQEEGELNQDRKTAGDQRPPGLGLAARGEQALHDQLIRSMACGGEERTSDHAGPQRVSGGKAPRRIEDAKLASRPGDGANGLPSSRD